MNIIIRWLVSATSILIAAYLLSGISVASFWAAFWLALLLGLLNAVLKPILIVLTLPITILTLGLFTFVINALIVLLASTIIKGFEVESFLAALFFAILVSVVSYLLNTFLGTKK